MRVCISKLACGSFAYFFSQFFFFFFSKNRDSFLSFKNNQIDDDYAVLNFLYFFLWSLSCSVEFHTNRTKTM